MKTVNIDFCCQQSDVLMRALSHCLDYWHKLNIVYNGPKTDPCSMQCVSVSTDELI